MMLSLTRSIRAILIKRLMIFLRSLTEIKIRMREEMLIAEGRIMIMEIKTKEMMEISLKLMIFLMSKV